ncbi:MAG TPA: hypothetical protein VF974_03775 [Patescibacteria group bacterium]
MRKKYLLRVYGLILFVLLSLFVPGKLSAQNVKEIKGGFCERSGLKKIFG